MRLRTALKPRPAIDWVNPQEGWPLRVAQVSVLLKKTSIVDRALEII